jgi:hypothetical protein
MDVTKKDLASILPGPTVMVVTVSASNSHGQDLTDEEQAHIAQAGDMAFDLGKALDKMLKVSMHVYLMDTLFSMIAYSWH